MFVWLNKQGVRCDEGFELQFTGRFTAEYREGDRVIDLQVDGDTIIVVNNAGSPHWRECSNLSPENRTRILANIKAALEFMDLRLWENAPPFN